MRRDGFSFTRIDDMSPRGNRSFAPASSSSRGGASSVASSSVASSAFSGGRGGGRKARSSAFSEDSSERRTRSTFTSDVEMTGDDDVSRYSSAVARAWRSGRRRVPRAEVASFFDEEAEEVEDEDDIEEEGEDDEMVLDSEDSTTYLMGSPVSSEEEEDEEDVEENDDDDEEDSDGETLGSVDSERSVDSTPHTSDEEFIDDSELYGEDVTSDADWLSRSRWSSDDDDDDVNGEHAAPAPSWSDCEAGRASTTTTSTISSTPRSGAGLRRWSRYGLGGPRGSGYCGGKRRRPRRVYSDSDSEDDEAVTIATSSRVRDSDADAEERGRSRYRVPRSRLGEERHGGSYRDARSRSSRSIGAEWRGVNNGNTFLRRRRRHNRD